jgi:hypothetical protein
MMRGKMNSNSGTFGLEANTFRGVLVSLLFTSALKPMPAFA